MTRKFMALMGAALLFFNPVSVHAQGYPNKPIRIMVGYAPGGGSDIIARLLAQNLQTKLGQPVVVENRAGAGGNLAIDIVAKASPDGYTLLVTPNTNGTYLSSQLADVGRKCLIAKGCGG